MSEFLNPKSMLTPGIAGAMLMFLTNGLSGPFPQLPPRYIALALSFLFGAFVMFRASKMIVPERLAYWVVNSLIIFVVGFGAANLSHEAASPSATSSGRAFAALLPSAYADEPHGTAPAKDTASTSAAKEPDKTPAAQPAVEKKKTEEKAKKATPDSSFFKKW